jgi:hypothetical protein
VQKLGLNGNQDWRIYCTSGQKPADIPYKPERTYKDNWVSWGHWLGTGTIASINRKFRNFRDARKHSHEANLKSHKDWTEYCRLGKKPEDIPYKPDRTYKTEWKGWGDWLGTDRVRTQDLSTEHLYALGRMREISNSTLKKLGKNTFDSIKFPMIYLVLRIRCTLRLAGSLGATGSAPVE